MLAEDSWAELAGNTIPQPSFKPSSLDNQPSVGKVPVWRLIFLSGNYYGLWCVPMRLQGC